MSEKVPLLDTWKKHYWFSVAVTRSRIEEIVRRAAGSSRILDAGCNEGFLSKALLEAGLHVYSVDNNQEVAIQAKEKFGIEVINADVCDLPFMDGFFDLAIGGELLEHLENPGIGLAELFRVSRSRVILTLPLGEYWLGEQTHKWCIHGATIEHDEGRVTLHPKEVLILEFEKRVQK